MRSGALHVAVGFQDAGTTRREHAGTRRCELAEEPMVLALPPGHRLAARPEVALADLAEDGWTVPSHDGLIARACRAAGFEPRVTVLTSGPLAIGAVVRAGLAVTLTPRLLAPQLPGVRIADVAPPAPRRAHYALLPDRGARAPELWLLEELRVAIEVQAWA